MGPRIFLGLGASLELEVKTYTSITLNVNALCSVYNYTHIGNQRLPRIATVMDDRWHHVAYAQGLYTDQIFFDGELVRNCSNDPTLVSQTFAPLAVANSVIQIGTYDTTLGSANSNAFIGYLDDVRVFASVLDQGQVRSLMARSDLTDEELAETRASIVFDFDSTDDSGFVPDVSGQANHGYMGGQTSSLLARWPLVVAGNTAAGSEGWDEGNGPSLAFTNAPSLGPRKIIQARQISQAAPASTPGQYDVPITFEPLDANTYAATPFLILNVSRSDGSPGVGGMLGKLYSKDALALAASGGPPAPSLALEIGSNLMGTEYVYLPAVGEFGVVLELALSPGGILSGSPSFLLQIVLRPNAAPLAGGGGGALYCDGIDDYAFTPNFEWPMMTRSMPDGSVMTGGKPVTAEFWVWVDASSELDSSLFNIGNAEQNVAWVNAFSPYRQQGRFIARFPFTGGVFDFTIQATATATDARPYYNAWTHVAIVHDQLNGTTVALYLNGELVAQGVHDHDAVGTGGFTPVKSLSLCMWGFWSEVYSKATMDEFRLWSYSRTQDEIRRDMYTVLTGQEEHLEAYYNFDDALADKTQDPRIIKDVTRKNGGANDLWMGGCAPCGGESAADEYHRGWMAYDPDHGVFPPDNTTAPDPAGPGYRVCLPSAKSYTSPAIQLGVVFGATSRCFGAIGQGAPSTYPLRLISTAPIAGNVQRQTAEPGGVITIQLNATDPDALDVADLQFRIDAVPSSALGMLTYGQSHTVVTAGTLLPKYVSQLTFTPTAGVGGAPLAVVVFRVDDGLLSSNVAQSIPLYLQCPAGTYIDAAHNLCTPCPAGAFQPEEHLGFQCQLCPRHQYTDSVGQLMCKACVKGQSYSPIEGGTSCIQCDSADAQTSAQTASLAQSSTRTDVGSLVANDYQCATPVSRDNDLGPSDVLFIDLLNQTSVLDVFDPTQPILAYIASLPQTIVAGYIFTGGLIYGCGRRTEAQADRFSRRPWSLPITKRFFVIHILRARSRRLPLRPLLCCADSDHLIRDIGHAG